MKNSKEELIQELKANGIVDTKVLESIKLVPRSFFVDNSTKSRSNVNIALPIECGQTISQPLVVAFMTQNLFLNKRLRVLEIGTGSGYQTVILSKLSRFVYTIERYLFLKIILCKYVLINNLKLSLDKIGFRYASDALHLLLFLIIV